MSDYAEHPLPPARRETQDVGFRILALSAGGVLLVIALLSAVSWWMFPEGMKDQADTRPVPGYPAPRLQPSPPADMQAFLRQQMQWLNSTGWVDRNAGIAHIPIGDAMRKVAADNIPDWPKAPPTEVQR
ncbi:MAG: hypothetical protein ACJ8AW_01305 [Rhodopila sp.]